MIKSEVTKVRNYHRMACNFRRASLQLAIPSSFDIILLSRKVPYSLMSIICKGFVLKPAMTNSERFAIMGGTKMQCRSNNSILLRIQRCSTKKTFHKIIKILKFTPMVHCSCDQQQHLAHICGKHHQLPPFPSELEGWGRTEELHQYPLC